jgi:hypothetical protein
MLAGLWVWLLTLLQSVLGWRTLYKLSQHAAGPDQSTYVLTSVRFFLSTVLA